MKVLINDTSVDLDGSNTTLEKAVLHSGINDIKGVAVAVNNTVIPRTNWNMLHLNENDTITIIRATQGG